jgi:hypothetical protein
MLLWTIRGSWQDMKIQRSAKLDIEQQQAYDAIMLFCRKNTHSVLTIECSRRWGKSTVMNQVIPELTRAGFCVGEFRFVESKRTEHEKTCFFARWLRIYLAIGLHCNAQILNAVHCNCSFLHEIIAPELFEPLSLNLTVSIPEELDVIFFKHAEFFLTHKIPLEALGKCIAFKWASKFNITKT